MQKALNGMDRLERARTKELEFFEEVLRQEDKKRKLAEKLPKEADDGAPPAQSTMSQAASPVPPRAQAKRQARLDDATKTGSGSWNNLDNARPRIAKSSAMIAS